MLRFGSKSYIEKRTAIKYNIEVFYFNTILQYFKGKVKG